MRGVWLDYSLLSLGLGEKTVKGVVPQNIHGLVWGDRVLSGLKLMLIFNYTVCLVGVLLLPGNEDVRLGSLILVWLKRGILHLLRRVYHLLSINHHLLWVIIVCLLVIAHKPWIHRTCWSYRCGFFYIWTVYVVPVDLANQLRSFRTFKLLITIIPHIHRPEDNLSLIIPVGRTFPTHIIILRSKVIVNPSKLYYPILFIIIIPVNQMNALWRWSKVKFSFRLEIVVYTKVTIWLIQSAYVPHVTQLFDSCSFFFIDLKACQNKLFDVLWQVTSKLVPVQWYGYAAFQLFLGLAVDVRRRAMEQFVD